MQEFIEDLCDNIGTKRVTKTDKNKGAFVLNEAQKIALSAAGFEPGDGGDDAILLFLEVPNDPDGSRLEVSYYNSIRAGAGRTPEARMGRDIVRWMEIGDEIHLANIGSTVFVWKGQSSNLGLNEVAGGVASEVDKNVLLGKARQATGKPSRQEKIINDFRRNAAVVSGAVARADGRCEMPDCSRDLFRRRDGTTFLEVHHITPLAEGGEDTMANAAALCPTCHRELHYGQNKMEMREKLKAEILRKEL